jgi:hypothetical protein
MTSRRCYRCRLCGETLTAWLPVQQRSDTARRRRRARLTPGATIAPAPWSTLQAPRLISAPGNREVGSMARCR